MHESFYKYVLYDPSFYEKLKSSYELAFKKPFLNKDVYESRFLFDNRYSALLLVDDSSYFKKLTSFGL